MRYAIVMSETGKEQVIEAASAAEAIEKSFVVVRYSSEVSEWPEYDRLSVMWEKGQYELIREETHRKFLEECGERNSKDFPRITGDLLVIFPFGGEQCVYIYETDHDIWNIGEEE